MDNRKDYFNRLNKPTVLQINYLAELSKLDKRQRKRGAVSTVAERCGVNHAAVSRFFKSCLAAGYIDAKNGLTEEGEEWLDHYMQLKDGVEAYLRGNGIPERTIPANAQAMMENMDDHTLRLIIEKARKDSRRMTNISPERHKNPLAGIVQRGNYDVSFRFMKYDRKATGGVAGLSMADQGFEKPAILKCNNRGLFLELTLKEIEARSKLTGILMKGHMTSLKYEREGELYVARMRNGKVHIPLDFCEYEMRGNGEVIAMMNVTLTCSVGRMHMPESSALLVFWL